MWSFTELRFPSAVGRLWILKLSYNTYSWVLCSIFIWIFCRIIYYKGPYCTKVWNQYTISKVEKFTNPHRLLWKFLVFEVEILTHVRTDFKIVFGKLLLSTVVGVCVQGPIIDLLPQETDCQSVQCFVLLHLLTLTFFLNMTKFYGFQIIKLRIKMALFPHMSCYTYTHSHTHQFKLKSFTL